MAVTPASIIEFWLGAASDDVALANTRWDLWYRGGAEVDQQIAEQFGHAVTTALDGGYRDWEGNAEGALALVILLDQFTRNLYRGTPQAYVGDKRALAVAQQHIDARNDAILSISGRAFLYHPFHHSEELDDQDRAVQLFQHLHDGVPAGWKEHVAQHLDATRGHREIVRRFGRFPHRNRVLGRVSSPEEVAFLDEDPDSYGQ